MRKLLDIAQVKRKHIAHRATTKEPTINKFADLLDRAKAMGAETKELHGSPKPQKKPSNWSTMTEKEKRTGATDTEGGLWEINFSSALFNKRKERK